MNLNMNVKVVVALNRSLKLLPAQVDLKSDLDLESLPSVGTKKSQPTAEFSTSTK